MNRLLLTCFHSFQDFALKILKDNSTKLKFQTKSQQESIVDTRKNLKPGHFQIVMDFSENFTHVIQNSIQGAYFNQNQTSLLTVIIVYYMHQDMASFLNLIYENLVL